MKGKSTMKKLMMILAMVVSLALVAVAGVGANSIPVIDGTISPGEWDAYYLGTSVTGWSGGMSVDVYGFADDTYLYVAYVADMTQPGWGAAASLCISANLDYQTPQSASWPDPGYTHISVYGDGFAQTDGSGWNWPDGWGNTDPSVFTSRGIEYYVGEPCYGSPYPNTAEIKIPLSLLTYAGDGGQIGLGGQYWQYDWAAPFYVTLLVPQCTTDCYVDDDGDDANGGTSWEDAKQTIQAAVDQVNAGGTVHVAAGVYAESVTLTPGKNLTITGAGRDVVTWVCPANGYCTNGDMSGYTGSMNYEISGFTFNVRSDSDTTWGAGIGIRRASSGHGARV
jgi:hypothetical protein